MKSFFILFLSILTVFPTVLEPYQLTTSLSKDQVLAKLAQFFAFNGISIKTVDKNMGLIQSDKIGFGTNCNLEGSDDSTAWALCNRILDDKYFLYPQVMNGELMFLVQEVGDKTQISIHFFNLNASHSSANGEINFLIRSTQVLEKMIAEWLVSDDVTPLKVHFDPPNAIFGEPKAQLRHRAQELNRQNAAIQVDEMARQKASKRAWLILLGFGLIIGGILIAFPTKKE